jgi:hypothetical protein
VIVSRSVQLHLSRTVLWAASNPHLHQQPLPAPPPPPICILFPRSPVPHRSLALPAPSTSELYPSQIALLPLGLSNVLDRKNTIRNNRFREILAVSLFSVTNWRYFGPKKFVLCLPVCFANDCIVELSAIACCCSRSMASFPSPKCTSCHLFSSIAKFST